MAEILFAEYDTAIRNTLEQAFRGEGYEVRSCRDGEEVLAAYAERRPDLLLLDVNIPKKCGYDVCVEIRRNDVLVPVVFLAENPSEETIMLGLDLGADAFIPKSVRQDVLLARLAVIMKWKQRVAAASAQNDTFIVGNVQIDATRFTVRNAGAPEVTLTARELGLLRAFAAHPGEVLSRDTLLDAVWGENYFASSRTLDQHIVQIRRKLGKSGDLIETVRGIGYRLRA